MSRLYYMSLPGVGPWDVAIKEVGAQFRPYTDYLTTAIRAAKRRKPCLAWRVPQDREQREFQRRLDARRRERDRRAAQGKHRRDRRIDIAREGHWIVLEPPPWNLESSEDTFEDFLEAHEVHDDADCDRTTQIKKLEFDREGRALLLSRRPEPVPSPTSAGAVSSTPTAVAPFGPLLWLRPNTYALERQRHAVLDLENAPPPRLAPIARLAATRATWPKVVPPPIEETEWVFLARNAGDAALRDGTEEQRRFVAMALGTPDFAILEGPPGSGKTTAICELIAQLTRRGQRVLLVASTHVAVDNVLERLITWQDQETTGERFIMPIRIGEDDRVTSDVVVPWTFRRLRQTWKDQLVDFIDSARGGTPAGAGARRLLREAIDRPDFEDSSLTRLLLESANLVCGTTIGILQHPAIKAARQGEVFEPFDVMILDEASKTTFSEFLVPARHARRWIVSGDLKQLSPYVEETDLAENIRGLVPEELARAAAYAYLASGANGRPSPSVLVVRDQAEASIIQGEADARAVAYVHLNERKPETIYGVPQAIPELLFADLIFGSADAVREFEHRLPPDAVVGGSGTPALPDHDAAVRACAKMKRSLGQHPEDPETAPEWADEVAWRLVRSYELRQNVEERDRYLHAIDKLLPATLGDNWFSWRRMRARGTEARPEPARDALKRELNSIRRVAMPSILELLQRGFERLDGWNQQVALTDGLPDGALRERLASLSFQHRMHPHISAFSRASFYTSAAVEGSQTLLRDATGVDRQRDWGYGRYARRALWIDVAPGRVRARGGNMNGAEAETLIAELRAFVAWATANPRRAQDGKVRPWEVALLTFYRGQEALLRDELRHLTGQWGNSRTFGFGNDGQTVHVTLCTVDRFQGHEADLVFVSFVKSGSVGFLNSPNRLNVALTRARFQIVLIGHRAFFAKCKSPLLASLATSPHYSRDIGFGESS